VFQAVRTHDDNTSRVFANVQVTIWCVGGGTDVTQLPDETLL
jgi:hypothetical protein